MALKPEHRQEEWYQQMINAATGKYLPSITAQDAGKVMTVESDGSWGVEDIPQELPSVTSADETKVLTVDSNGDWVAADAPSGLPSVSASDSGKVLAVDNSGVWGASELPNRLFDIDVNVDVEFTRLTPTSTAVYPTADELEMICSNNAAVACHLHVNDVSVNNTIYLRPARIDGDGLLYLYGESMFDDERKFCYGSISTEGIVIDVSKDSRFIVTLTPTSTDYSGTMDKTVAEIDAAYKAGQQVVFAIGNGTDSYTVDCTIRYSNGNMYPSYEAYMILGGNFICAFTGATNNGDKTTYETNIYPLTPAT